jgi:sugar lactone lactonase YvrE
MFAAGLHLPECPRWHDGALWLSDMWGHTVLRYGADGAAHVVHRFEEDEDPGGLGWLPDGRLLVVGMESRVVHRIEGDRAVVHADLRDLAPFQLNDMAVAPDGTAYVTQFGYDLWGHGAYAESAVIRVTPDGTVSVAAEALGVPNGIAVRGDELVVAEAGAGRISRFRITAEGLRDRRTIELEKKPGAAYVSPDGLCLDADGGIWTADPSGQRVLHVTADGTVDLELPIDDGHPLACVLGGPDRRTLFVCVGGHLSRPTRPPEPTGRVLTFAAEVPGEGTP